MEGISNLPQGTVGNIADVLAGNESVKIEHKHVVSWEFFAGLAAIALLNFFLTKIS